MLFEKLTAVFSVVQNMSIMRENIYLFMRPKSQYIKNEQPYQLYFSNSLSPYLLFAP